MCCVSTSFSICFTAKNVCRSDTYFYMLTIFVWCSTSSFCFSSKVTSSSRVSTVIPFSFSVNSFIRPSCNLSRCLSIFLLSSRISFSTNMFCSLTALAFVSLFCLILPIVSINSSIYCSISLNKLEVFIFLIIFSRTVTSLQSL